MKKSGQAANYDDVTSILDQRPKEQASQRQGERELSTLHKSPADQLPVFEYTDFGREPALESGGLMNDDIFTTINSNNDNDNDNQFHRSSVRAFDEDDSSEASSLANNIVDLARLTPIARGTVPLAPVQTASDFLPPSPFQIVEHFFTPERRFPSQTLYELQSNQRFSPIGSPFVLGSTGPTTTSNDKQPQSTSFLKMSPFAVPNNLHPLAEINNHNNQHLIQTPTLRHNSNSQTPHSEHNQRITFSPMQTSPHLKPFQHSFDGGAAGLRVEPTSESNFNQAMPSIEAPIGATQPQKQWPKIFRFTDGRASLSDFEREKKLYSRNNHHQLDAPIIFEGRQLKRKSFLILHGGIF